MTSEVHTSVDLHSKCNKHRILAATRFKQRFYYKQNLHKSPATGGRFSSGNLRMQIFPFAVKLTLERLTAQQPCCSVTTPFKTSWTNLSLPEIQWNWPALKRYSSTFAVHFSFDIPLSRSNMLIYPHSNSGISHRTEFYQQVYLLMLEILGGKSANLFYRFLIIIIQESCIKNN